MTEFKELLDEVLAMDWGIVLGGIALIIAGYPVVKKKLDEFESNSGFQFPWTTRKRELQKKFQDVDDKIEQKYKELGDRITNIHNAEHVEQEAWHQQSIAIRDDLTAHQETLEKNQDQFFKTLANISESLSEIKSDLVEERLERKRWNILNCATQLRNGNEIDAEQYNNVFKDYDSYEDLIKRSGRKNGLIEESIKFIREKYHESLKDDSDK